MRSSCSVKLSGRPSPAFTGGAAAHFSVPSECYELPEEALIAKVYACYQADQLRKFAHTEYAQQAQGNYLKFVAAIELFEKTAHSPLLWTIGNGFTIHSKASERILCDRHGRLIEKGKVCS